MVGDLRAVVVRQLRRPGMAIVAAFTGAIAVFTVLFLLPASTEPGVETTFVQALFTATSAICITGLSVVDTPNHWSTFGELLILGACSSAAWGSSPRRRCSVWSRPAGWASGRASSPRRRPVRSRSATSGG